MKAVIFCADCDFAARANSILQRVGNRPDVNTRWTVKAWPINILHHAAMSDEALFESGDAHLIIIPADYAKTLPVQLRDWLERWATTRHVEDAAVGAVGEAANHGFEDHISADLKVLVKKHGLHLITNEGSGVKPGVNLPVTFSAENEQALHLSQIPRAKAPNSVRPFGFNGQA